MEFNRASAAQGCGTAAIISSRKLDSISEMAIIECEPLMWYVVLGSDVRACAGASADQSCSGWISPMVTDVVVREGAERVKEAKAQLW